MGASQSYSEVTMGRLRVILLGLLMTSTCLASETCQTAAELGADYHGSVSWTVNGNTCQRWDAQTPHAHTRATDSMPLWEQTEEGGSGSASDGENFCRNPDDWPGGAWCYTTNDTVRWEYCPVPFCEAPAPADVTMLTEAGGTTDIDDSAGAPCVFPFEYAGETYDACTYANGHDRPWCSITPVYETNRRWGYCEECQNAPNRGQEYHGTMAMTNNGRTCQRWDSQEPHAHTRATDSMPIWEQTEEGGSGSASDGENFCRNPDNWPGGAWCYTTDEDVRWEYCAVPFCEEPRPVMGEGVVLTDPEDTEGNAGNSPVPCVFPFVYDGVEYNACTTANNHEIPWCSLTSDYAQNRRWGHC